MSIFILQCIVIKLQTGVIPHNTNMMCGFVYLPSFESPCFSEYLLNVSNTESCDYKKVCASLLLEAKVVVSVIPNIL